MSVKKPLKQGLDFFRDKQWNPIVRNRAGAIREGEKAMPACLRKCGFGVEVCDCGDYYRINYGHK